VPVQSVSPAAQTHWPSAQTLPPPQVVPQVPQLVGSDWRSTQLLLHETSGMPQPRLGPPSPAIMGTSSCPPPASVAPGPTNAGLARSPHDKETAVATRTVVKPSLPSLSIRSPCTKHQAVN
jgi:hypothetical protein